MPYDIRRSGSQYQVVGPEGRVMGTHPTRAEAMGQQRALYANEPDASKAEQPIESSWAGLFFPRRG
jgi:hypothetical protein